MPKARPYVGAALFCERILTEEGGVRSFMRVIDTGEIDLPPNLPLKPAIDIQAVVILKIPPEETRADYGVELIGHSPSGTRMTVGAPVRVSIEEQGGGANIAARIAFPVEEYGVYWFDVVVDGEVLTKMPLTLRRVPSSPSSQTPSGTST
jgi:hypothetical protein